MRDIPIIFSAPMVDALLEGRKTMTRRILSRRNVTVMGDSWAGKKSPWEGLRFSEARSRGHCLALPFCHPQDEPMPSEECGIYKLYPVVEVGDRLWVKEAHYLTDDGDSGFAVYAEDVDAVREHLASVDGLPSDFPADVRARHRRLRSPIHMPHWASRITLEVTAVRIERLHDLTEEDAKAEGFDPHESPGTWTPHKRSFAEFWCKLHRQTDWWLVNPFVLVISFKVHLCNIDALPLPGEVPFQ